MNPIKELRQELEQRKGKKAQIEQDISQTRQQYRNAKRGYSQHERALEIVKLVGLKTQKELEFHLAEPVSLGLAAVFDDPYQLVVNFQSKRGKTEAELFLERRNLKIPPIGFTGKGARDVTAFVLRPVYMSMQQEKVRPVLLLDEPFAGLKGNTANMRALELVKEISHELKIQIIMISDERVPREDIIENADRTFLITQKKGKSEIQQL